MADGIGFDSNQQMDANPGVIAEAKGAVYSVRRRKQPRPRTVRSEAASEREKYIAQTQGGLLAIRDLLLDENARLSGLLDIAREQKGTRHADLELGLDDRERRDGPQHPSTRRQSFQLSPAQHRSESQADVNHANRPAPQKAPSRLLRLRVHKNTFLPRPYAAPNALYSIDDSTSTLPTTPQLEAKLARLMEAEKERLGAKLRALERKISEEDLFLPEGEPSSQPFSAINAPAADDGTPLSQTGGPDQKHNEQLEQEFSALHQIILHLSSESHIAKLALHRDREELRSVAQQHLHSIRADMVEARRAAQAGLPGESGASRTPGGGLRGAEGRDGLDETRTSGLAMDRNGTEENGALLAETDVSNNLDRPDSEATGAEPSNTVEMINALEDLRGYVDLLTRYWHENTDLPPPGIYQNPVFPMLNAPPIPAAQIFPRRPGTISAAAKVMLTDPVERRIALSATRNEAEQASATARVNAAEEDVTTGITQPMPENLRRAVRMAKRAVEREASNPELKFGPSVPNASGAEEAEVEDDLGGTGDEDQEEGEESGELMEAFRMRLLKRRIVRDGSDRRTAEASRPAAAAPAPAGEYPNVSSSHFISQSNITRGLHAETASTAGFNGDDPSAFSSFDEQDPSWNTAVPYQVQFRQRQADHAQAIPGSSRGHAAVLDEAYLVAGENDRGRANAIMASTLSGAIAAGQQGFPPEDALAQSRPANPGVEGGPCANCGRLQTTVWRVVLVGNDRYKVCNPCGLHHAKNNVMRPPSTWSAEAPRSRRHRNPKVPKEKTGTGNSRGRPRGSMKRDKLEPRPSKRRKADASMTEDGALEDAMEEDEGMYDSAVDSPSGALQGDTADYGIDPAALPSSQAELDGLMRHLYSNVQAGENDPLMAAFESSVNADVSALMRQQNM